jgi:hypothetical protein
MYKIVCKIKKKTMISIVITRNPSLSRLSEIAEPIVRLFIFLEQSKTPSVFRNLKLV